MQVPHSLHLLLDFQGQTSVTVSFCHDLHPESLFSVPFQNVPFVDDSIDLPQARLVGYFVFLLDFLYQVLQVMDFASHLLQVCFGAAQLCQLLGKHILLKLELAQLRIVHFADIIAVLAAAKCLHQVHCGLVGVVCPLLH